MPGYKAKTALVLGASGFIGQWVARKLCDAGACTCLVVRNAAAACAAFERYGIRGEVVEADLSHPAALFDIYGRFRPSVTFNLAGYGVDPLEREPHMAYQMNAELPSALCDAVAVAADSSWRGQHIVHAGSAAEYGDAGGDLRENGPARPTTLYGQSKLKGTLAVAERAAACGLRAVTARLFTVYGPGEHSGRLLPSLIEASRDHKPLDLTAGVQRRDFTYVEDVAEGLLRLGLLPANEPVVNLATGRLTPVRTFVEIAAGVLGIPPASLRFGVIPLRANEMEHEAVSIERLNGFAGWIPPTSIAEGIRKTAEAVRPDSQRFEK
jgi:nucleoside-diphosphate-sugar epimerase